MLIDRLKSVSPTSSPSYSCEFCSLEFERERLNCPACGFDVRQEC